MQGGGMSKELPISASTTNVYYNTITIDIFYLVDLKYYNYQQNVKF